MDTILTRVLQSYFGSRAGSCWHSYVHDLIKEFDDDDEVKENGDGGSAAELEIKRKK